MCVRMWVFCVCVCVFACVVVDCASMCSRSRCVVFVASANRLSLAGNQLVGTVPTVLSRFPIASSTWSSNCLANASNPYAGCDLTDRSGLVDVYCTTYGAGWKSSSTWLTSAHPCTWFGVGCDSTTGPITSLTLPGNGLVGTVPDSLCTLTALTFLNVASNNVLTGTIPSTVSTMTRLQYVQ